MRSKYLEVKNCFRNSFTVLSRRVTLDDNSAHWVSVVKKVFSTRSCYSNKEEGMEK